MLNFPNTNEWKKITSRKIKNGIYGYELNIPLYTPSGFKHEFRDRDGNYYLTRYVYSRLLDNEEIGIKLGDNIIPIKNLEWRLEEPLYTKTKKIIDIVQVGDFVKCKGTRSGDWNKVVKITHNGIFGPKYTAPKEGCMRYVSSENGFSKITKIVREGKEILCL